MVTSASNEQRCLVNGQWARAVDASDRGIAYGDGLFETISIRDGRPCLWGKHLNRLLAGASRLGIPAASSEQLRADAVRITQGTQDGALKVIVTRGPSSRGYTPPANARATRLLLYSPEAEASTVRMVSDGIAVRLCKTRLGINPQLAGIKHLNRLEQVLARSEWRDPGVFEGLMLDIQGYLVCGTMSNLFIVDESGLSTAPIDRCGIAGTVRALLFGLAAEEGVGLRERRLKVADLLRARGAFLTNSMVGILPVREFDGHRYRLDALPWHLLHRAHALASQPERDW